MNTKKENILHALDTFIRQGPGVEFCNYGNVPAYRAEMRSITRDRRYALELLARVRKASVTAEELMAGFQAYSGRLTCELVADGVRLDYCTGQYFPTEYRKAACAVLSSALWDHYREAYSAAAKPGESPGSAIRRQFRREFGRTIASRYFN